MKKFLYTLFIFIIGFVLTAQGYAVEPRGNFKYNVEFYEHDLDFSSSYELKSNERFFAVCDAMYDEYMPTMSKTSRNNLVTLYSLLWDTTYSCHFSVIDVNRRGKIVKSSGTFEVKTPVYRTR